MPAISGPRIPAAPDVIGGIAIWIEETFNGIEVKTSDSLMGRVDGKCSQQSGLIISFSMPETRVFYILCMSDYLCVDHQERLLPDTRSRQLRYEQPDFFDKLEIIIIALLMVDNPEIET